MQALGSTRLQRAANTGKSVNVGAIGHVDPPRKRPRLYRHEGIGHVISEASIESCPSSYSPIYL